MDPTNDNSSAISSDLIRGHINTIILRTLYDGDKYGYEIINEIEEKSKGQYTLKQPTLYSALKRLESQDFVTSYWGGVSNGGRRKYFQITDKGKKVVEQNLAEWEYSRTVIDSLISEKDYDFNNPPPSAVDFSLLKKSTTRVKGSGELDHDDIELGFNESEREPEEEETDAFDASDEEQADVQADEQPESEPKTETFIDESATELPYPIENDAAHWENSATFENEPAPADAAESVQTPFDAQSPEPEDEQNFAASSADNSDTYTETYREESEAAQIDQIDEEQRRIQHENYRNLVGNEDDATAYYYAQVARQNREQAAAEQAQSVTTEEPAYPEEPPAEYDGYANGYDGTYLDNRAISSELLYSNRSPAERNYKDLLSRLYENNHPEPEQTYDEYEPSAPYETAPQSQQQPMPPQETEPMQEQAAEPQYNAAPPAPAATAQNTSEFYDIEEHAENDGLRITTSTGARNRTAPANKTTGNVFDKGKALFMSALYVFVLALIECIINLCIRNAIHSNAAYVVLPFVAAFVMFGVFLFLYLRGYGKNSRKTQSRSYISASLILFANLVIIICLIAYLIIYNASTPVSFVQILKYGILPVIFVFNIPLFAIFYSYHSNKQ